MIKKILIALCLLFTGVSIASASFVVSSVESDQITINYNEDGAICYNGTTNEKYTNIQKALDEASSGQYIYVYIGVNVNITYDITIESGKHLVLPFVGQTNSDLTGTNVSNTPLYIISSGDDHTSYGNVLGDQNSSRVNTYRSIALNLRNGADIYVYGGLHVGGATSYRGNNGYYSEINLGANSSIYCYDGATFDCYGYVKENYDDYSNPYNNGGIYNNEVDEGRAIEVYSGATLNTYLAMYDIQQAGNVTGLLGVNQSPFSTFDLQGLQTYTLINSGSTINAYALVVGPSSIVVFKQVTILSSNTSSDSMFYMTSGTFSIENYNLGDPRYSSRTITDAKTSYIVNGTLDFGYLNITEGNSLASITLDTREMFFPMSCRVDLVVGSGGVFNIDNKMKFLMGSKLTVDVGGQLNINSEVIFYDSSIAPAYNADDDIFYNYTGDDDAELIVNGKLTLGSNGKLGATITNNTGSETSVLDFTSNTSQQNLTVTSLEGLSETSVIKTSSGLRYDSNNYEISTGNFLAGYQYVGDYVNQTYIWSGYFEDSYTISITVADTSYDYEVLSYSIYAADDSSGTNSYSLIESGTTSNSYILNSDQYVYISISRAYSYSIKDDNGVTIDYTLGTWVNISKNMNIEIVPNEGVKVAVNYTYPDGKDTSSNSDWASGTGHVTVTYYESLSQNGDYYTIGTSGLSRSPSTDSYAIVIKNAYFYFSWTTESNTIYDWASDQNGIITTDPADYELTITSSWNPTDNSRTSGVFVAGAHYTFTMYWWYEITTCVTAGTLITMSDGSQRKVENITSGDEVLVFNHETGSLDTSTIIYNFHTGEESIYTEVLTAKFANGSEVRIVGEHAFYDQDLREYVYISSATKDTYIGDEFYYLNGGDGGFTKLVSVTSSYEEVNYYSPITANTFNVFTNNMLSISGEMSGLINIFENDENMKVDIDKMNGDIEEYGLFKYSDFADVMTKKSFDAFNVKYLKVAIGKGLLTYDRLEFLISTYLTEIEASY